MPLLTEPDQVWPAVQVDRLLLADWAERWSPAVWESATPCQDWVARAVVAHLVSMATATKSQGLRAYLSAGANLDAASHALADQVVAGRTDTQILALLREHAGAQHTSPGLRPVGILAELVTHLEDLSVAVGEAVHLPADHLETTLVYLQRRTRKNTRFHLTAQGRQPVLDGARRTQGLRLRATDIGWTHDPTAPTDPRDAPCEVRATVEGSAAALVLAMAGRQVGAGTVVGELTGDGVTQLLSPAP